MCGKARQLRANRVISCDLFDHEVGAREDNFRYRQPKRLRRLEIDGKIELGWLLERYVSRLRSAQNLVDQFNSSARQNENIRSVGDQAALLGIDSKKLH
jgi:hypothetical protein